MILIERGRSDQMFLSIRVLHEYECTKIIYVFVIVFVITNLMLF